MSPLHPPLGIFPLRGYSHYCDPLKWDLLRGDGSGPVDGGPPPPVLLDTVHLVEQGGEEVGPSPSQTHVLPGLHHQSPIHGEDCVQCLLLHGGEGEVDCPW